MENAASSGVSELFLDQSLYGNVQNSSLYDCRGGRGHVSGVGDALKSTEDCLGSLGEGPQARDGSTENRV